MKAEELIKNIGRGSGLKFQRCEFAATGKTRRELNFLWRSAKDEDKRGVRMVIKSLDDWIDNSVDAGLASGDPAAIEALKKGARELAPVMAPCSRMAGRCRRQKVLQKITGTDVTPERGRESAVRLWRTGQTRFGCACEAHEEIVGDNSPEWGQYRKRRSCA